MSPFHRVTPKTCLSAHPNILVGSILAIPVSHIGWNHQPRAYGFLMFALRALRLNKGPFSIAMHAPRMSVSLSIHADTEIGIAAASAMLEQALITGRGQVARTGDQAKDVPPLARSLPHRAEKRAVVRKDEAESELAR